MVTCCDKTNPKGVGGLAVRLLASQTLPCLRHMVGNGHVKKIHALRNVLRFSGKTTNQDFHGDNEQGLYHWVVNWVQQTYLAETTNWLLYIICVSGKNLTFVTREFSLEENWSEHLASKIGEIVEQNTPVARSTPAHQNNHGGTLSFTHGSGE